ncbi:MAG: hypothetical protein WBM90_07835 [Acidimicrobiia bacterium]
MVTDIGKLVEEYGFLPWPHRQRATIVKPHDDPESVEASGVTGSGVPVPGMGDPG